MMNMPLNLTPPAINPNAEKVLSKRYYRKDENGQCVEDATGLFWRVASSVAAEEAKYEQSPWKPDALARAFYDMMTDWRFLPNSPTLMNAGSELGQLSACFVLPVGDSIEEIFDAVKFAAMIHKSGGGTGFSFSRLRPKNSRVGTTGGVAEAVVRHCLPDKSKNALREISILGLRGDAPIKEASVTIGDTELKLAVVNGLANAKKLLKEIDEGKKFYHLIEVMTCQGGCVGGAGQPYGLKKSKEKRGDGLHLSDNAAMFKRAERNPVVAQMMAEYGEERCHELLHVTYTNK